MKARIPLICAVVLALLGAVYVLANREMGAKPASQAVSSRVVSPAGDRTTPMQESAGQTALSKTPPAGMIVYSKLIAAPPKSKTYDKFVLFLKRVPGNAKPVQLTQVKENAPVKLGTVAWYPQFSPDGKSVLFEGIDSTQDPDYNNYRDAYWNRAGLDLYVVDVNSRKVRALTGDGAEYYNFVWSPDSKWIAVSSMGEPYVYLCAIDAISGRRSVLAKYKSGMRFKEVIIRSDSGDVLFTNWIMVGKQDVTRLYAIPLKGGAARLLSEGNSLRHDFRFSADGKRLAFLQGKGEQYGPKDAPDTLWVANADGTGARIVAKTYVNENWLGNPQWLENDTKIAAVVRVHKGSQEKRIGQNSLHLYDVATGQDTVLAQLRDGATALKPSSDGQWLMITTSRKDKEGLVAVRMRDGYQVTLKEPNEDTMGLDWVETK